MNLQDFYKPQVLKDYSNLLKEHLLAKYENNHGIIAITTGTMARYYGTSNREVLQNSLKYYNGLTDSSAYWFYVKDLEESLEQACL